MAYQENAKFPCGVGEENGHEEATLFILLTMAKSGSHALTFAWPEKSSHDDGSSSVVESCHLSVQGLR